MYYKEPRLAILLDRDVVKMIDNHLVVNLPKFITPKTKHLTKLAKRNLSSCCIGCNAKISILVIQLQTLVLL